MNWGRHVASGIQLHSEVSALMCSRSCCSRLLQAGDGADGSSGFLPLLGETWVGFPLGAVGPDRGAFESTWRSGPMPTSVLISLGLFPASQIDKRVL